MSITNEEAKTKQYKRFKNIDEDWRQEQMGATTEELFSRITKVAMSDFQLGMAQKFDEDLSKLKEQVKVASEPYTEGKKANKIRMEFLIQVLEDRGCPNIPSISDFIKAAANNSVDEDSE
jgi:outer membrane receptor for ferric coprogen and ferric-rhodotorulic acid